MDYYKNIVRSQSARLRILKAFRWVPDSAMLRMQHRIKFRRRLQLGSPERFTDRIQRYKIMHRDPVMTTCVDKIAAREFISGRGYGHLLTDLYATASNSADLDLDSLPKKFVLKTNNGSGTNIIVHDKSQMDAGALLELDEWLERDYYAATREWPYKDVPPRILAEELLEDTDNQFAGVNDYKVYCFDGSAKYILLAVDRPAGQKMNFYTTDWEDTGVKIDGTPNIPTPVSRPENLEELISVAENLSSGFPFVRVDLYSIAGKVYFGEMTFFPASGYVTFSPDSFDFELGKLWPASEK